MKNDKKHLIVLPSVVGDSNAIFLQVLAWIKEQRMLNRQVIPCVIGDDGLEYFYLPTHQLLDEHFGPLRHWSRPTFLRHRKDLVERGILKCTGTFNPPTAPDKVMWYAVDEKRLDELCVQHGPI